jgi:pathogenesis-related protein 1
MRARAPIFVIVLAACGACGGQIDADGDDTPPGDGPNNSGDGPNTVPPDAEIPGGTGEPANLMGITLAHNQIRAAVQTQTPLPFLTWNANLAATAAAWVAQCQDQDAPTGLIDHNDGRSTGHPYYVGENVFGSGGSATGQQAVELWAAEKANYTYATNSCSGVCGHYTQIVWRTTLEVGCAMGTCNNLQYKNSIVCNYGPGGNNGNPPY